MGRVCQGVGWVFHPGIVQSQLGWGLEQPDFVKNVLSHGLFQPKPFHNSKTFHETGPSLPHPYKTGWGQTQSRVCCAPCCHLKYPKNQGKSGKIKYSHVFFSWKGPKDAFHWNKNEFPKGSFQRWILGSSEGMIQCPSPQIPFFWEKGRQEM